MRLDRARVYFARRVVIFEEVVRRDFRRVVCRFGKVEVVRVEILFGRWGMRRDVEDRLAVAVVVVEGVELVIEGWARRIMLVSSEARAWRVCERRGPR